MKKVMIILMVAGAIIGTLGALKITQVRNRKGIERYLASSKKEEQKQEEETEIIETRKNMKCASGRAKTYMSYKMITAKSSKQYQYIEKYMKVNDKGFLVDQDGRIGIALGSYFGSIGSKYDIELESGTILKVVKIEAKDDSHTNNGCEQKWDKSVIEFVIDVKVAESYYGTSSNGYVNSGNYNNIEEFKGAIKSIYKVD